ncbi:aryl-alcohol dehydrogenase-like predicted oxidoreductase [Kribbella antiqua]|uniref:Aryl-alcohol dehydrogenase-like predicted oxidoreductase n=1 Tax=Kribbella antiqua TaxID=2512217 RepID=A0A4R2ID83_9ACTN|nr:aldo/keto reductase [Kribbella antiqua]TCO42551.1 aryl-alcohol dehydrogenase-like predicted oxidoreductase [Kribbella antiqua]
MTITELAGRVALGVAGMSFEPRDRAADLATIRAGIDAGTAILDTARAYTRIDVPSYGEELAAEAARGTSAIVGTKGGHSRIGPTTWDADISERRIRSDVETSLRVFGRLDLYYLHRVDLAEQPVEEGVGTLAALREEGKLARIGLSNVSVVELERAAAVARIDAVQNHHTAMGRESADVLEWCEANGVAFFAYSPLRSSAPAPHLADAAKARGVSVQRLQLRALLASSPVLSVVSGATRPETVLDSLAAESEPWDEALAAAYTADQPT